MGTFIRGLSQPLRTLYVVLPVLGVSGMVAFLLGAPDRAVTGPIGAGAVLLGLTLATNLNRAADTLAAAMKDYRPAGVDYSRSFMATPAYARAFGGFAVVVGAGFVLAAITAA